MSIEKEEKEATRAEALQYGISPAFPKVAN
jgi:hypothetical protein